MIVFEMLLERGVSADGSLKIEIHLLRAQTSGAKVHARSAGGTSHFPGFRFNMELPLIC